MSRLGLGLLAFAVWMAGCANESDRSAPFVVPTSSTTQASTTLPLESTTTLGGAVSDANNEGCFRWQQTYKHLEACGAYGIAAVTRYLYYTNVHSQNQARAKKADEDLSDRYQGQALEYVKQPVADWPSGENRVELPRIDIMLVVIERDGAKATMVTRERWVVKQGDGVLWQETAEYKVQLQEVQGLVMKKWVVVRIERN